MPDYTPTQQRILLLLSDGLPHTREEIRVCIDELSSNANIRTHLTILRKKLEGVGQAILYEFQGFPPKTVYRHVRLLASAYDGKT